MIEAQLRRTAVERAYQQLALGRDQHADVSRPGFREAVTAKRLPVERHKAGTRSTGKQPLAKNRDDPVSPGRGFLRGLPTPFSDSFYALAYESK